MKKKNGILGLVGVGFLTLLVATGSVYTYYQQQANHFLKVGIAVYDLEDPYIQTLTEEICNQLNGKKIAGKELLYDIFDASGNAGKQNAQLYKMMQQQYDMLLWNPVSPTTVTGFLEDAQKQEIPVILFNREPAKADLAGRKSVWYVGTDAKEAGKLQGQMLIRAWNTLAMDKNQNGSLDYILIEGEQAHADVINRTDAFLQTASATLSLNQIHVLSANWMRDSAFLEMETLTQAEVETIEAVICSNDSMALGVSDFYVQQNLTPPVIIGINGIQEMQTAIDTGSVYGTVDLNVPKQAETIFSILQGIFDPEEPLPEEIFYYLPQSSYTNP